MTDRKFGWHADPWEEAHEPAKFAASAGTLPSSAMYEEHVVEVFDQGQTSSCVGQSMAQAIRTRLHMATGKVFPAPSAQWIWTMARISEGSLNEETGCWPTSALRVVQELGYPTVAHWPFDPSKYDVKPDEEVARNAFDQKFTHGYKVIKERGAARVRELRAALAKGQIAIYGMTVTQAFCDLVGSAPQGIPAGESVGAHMQTIVGYSNGLFRVCNSWGTGWGDKGFWWAKEEVMAWDQATDFILVQVVAPPSS